MACTKFYQYLYGKQDVVVQSDHQPLETIFKNPLVILLLESAKRLLSVPVKKKEPVTPEVIQRLVAHYGSVSASLADLRLLILCVLGYAGFFRFNELVQLRSVIFNLKILS